MKIYIYGTGCGAGDLVDTVLPLEKVCAFVDGESTAESFLGVPVIRPEELARRDYDLVIVSSRQAEAIAKHCAALGIDGDKLLFLKNHQLLTDRNRCYERAEALLGHEFIKKLQDSQRLIRTPLWSEGERLQREDLENDYVRIKTLEAICLRLSKVPGAAAELGVYRGAFARCINTLLPDRKLFLFDTFCGFDRRETASCGEGFLGAHTNTDESRVLSALPYPEQAVICRGLFPASAQGVEERFALVSLDVDLEESSYQGLRWFLPRMNPGAYLLLHDYNNPKQPGVMAALTRYEEETGENLHAVPLCDVNGTLVICR